MTEPRQEEGREPGRQGLRLLGLRLGTEGRVVADLDTGSPAGRVLATFAVTRIRDITIANPDPDVFAEFASSIDEVRRITAAVTAFALASSALGPTADAPPLARSFRTNVRRFRRYRG